MATFGAYWGPCWDLGWGEPVLRTWEAGAFENLGGQVGAMFGMLRSHGHLGASWAACCGSWGPSAKPAKNMTIYVFVFG